jgi:hypothetical protein
MSSFVRKKKTQDVFMVTFYLLNKLCVTSEWQKSVITNIFFFMDHGRRHNEFIFFETLLKCKLMSPIIK